MRTLAPLPLPFEYHRVLESLTNRLKGTPYVHKGRTLGAGMDCLGHIFWLHQRLGLPTYLPPEAADYPEDFWRNGVTHVYLQRLMDQFAVIPDRCAQKGDWYLFVGVPKTAKVGHCGLVLDPEKGTFQHSYRRKGVSEASIRQRFWADRFFCTIRHKQMGRLHTLARQMPREMKV